MFEAHSIERAVIKSILQWYMWPALAAKFTKWLNDSLFRAFEKSRLIFAFVVFPISLIFFIVILLSTLATFVGIPTYPWLILLFIPQVIIIGFPVFLAFHLSALLLFKAYWGLFVGWLPGAKFMVKFIDILIDLFRPIPRKY